MLYHFLRLAPIPLVAKLSLSGLKHCRGLVRPFATIFVDARKPDVSSGETSLPKQQHAQSYTLSGDCVRVSIFDGLYSPQSCCVAAACLSRTRDLETHLAPLATTLVEINLPNAASVDCVAFFLQVDKSTQCTASVDWFAYSYSAVRRALRVCRRLQSDVFGLQK